MFPGLAGYFVYLDWDEGWMGRGTQEPLFFLALSILQTRFGLTAHCGVVAGSAPPASSQPKTRRCIAGAHQAATARVRCEAP